MSTDARLEELALLTEIERRVALDVEARNEHARRRSLVAWLIHEGYVNDVSWVPWSYSGGELERKIINAVPGALNPLERRLAQERWGSLDRLLGGQSVTLRISHKGLVRLAELRQALVSGRDREKFGLAWAGHHLDRDLAIALLEASRAQPVSVMFFDMNGMKQLNEAFGYDEADVAIKAFLRVIAFVVGDEGDTYRKHAEGDEVVVILRRGNADATRLGQGVLAQLGKETVRLQGTDVRLAASCGVVMTTSPEGSAGEIVKRAAVAMNEAKGSSRKNSGRSAYCVEGGRPVLV